jgi:hypothetical protein
VAEIPPTSQETILVDRVGIRKDVPLDQDIGGVERIDEWPHGLSLGTAVEGEQCRTKEAENKY